LLPSFTPGPLGLEPPPPPPLPLQAPGARVGLDKTLALQEQPPIASQLSPFPVKQPGEQPAHLTVVPVQDGSLQMARRKFVTPLQLDALVWQPLLLHIAHPRARQSPQFNPVHDCARAASGASTTKNTRKSFFIVAAPPTHKY
jgi:hypothetical protein